MKLLRHKKVAKKDVRDVVYDSRALKRAARESIKDQKAITKKAARLRAQTAH